MTAVTIRPETERLLVALLIATVVHLILIYQISFVPPQAQSAPHQTLDIILVQKSTEKIPEKVNYLAQATQEGGGNSTQDTRPATPMIAPFPAQAAEVVATPPLPQVAAATPVMDIEKLITPLLTEEQVIQPQETTAPEEHTAVGEDIETTQAAEEVPPSTLLMNIRTSLASLQAELDKKFRSYTQNERTKYISASTQEYQYAQYMDAWRRKVEQVGTKHYARAHYKKLSGSLVLDVALNADGTIRQVSLKKSSGHALLDNAAQRIVHQAAPFAAFPKAIRQEIDVLHITRTWEFIHDSLTSH
ncbi:MAG: TonB family protein [Pseudomonadota bacterium]|nr:TonB family protein [Pseudomonadota bacterium]